MINGDPLQTKSNFDHHDMSDTPNPLNNVASTSSCEASPLLHKEGDEDSHGGVPWYRRIFSSKATLEPQPPRHIPLGLRDTADLAKLYPPNTVMNRKYSVLTFLPMTLYEQFKHFFNLYFLLTAVSQCIPELAVGFWFSFVAPLMFVLTISLTKEAYDDVQRWRRDTQMNSEVFRRVNPRTGDEEDVAAKDITVGTYLVLHPNQRVPADCLLLHTSEGQGASFIRTDQLDGETDWKLRFPVRQTQQCRTYADIVAVTGVAEVDAPSKAIYNFGGVVTTHQDGGSFPVDLSHTMWANCVLATGTCVAIVMYTGKETRSAMNAATPSAKRGRLDDELNLFSKYLFALSLAMTFLLLSLQKFRGNWVLSCIRFIVLLSSVIPISMRVNLDMAKAMYCYFIMTDKKIEGCVVRTSSLPEELGRVWYLFSDKTGTLTRNEMEFRKLILGPQWKLDWDNKDDIVHAVSRHFTSETQREARRDIAGYSEEQMATIAGSVLGVALCHNVTPVHDEVTGERTYQASSPDEVALVKFCEQVGLTLVHRTLSQMAVETVHGRRLSYEIVKDFPFTSDRKRMGIILRCVETGEVLFLMKGADVVMQKIVVEADWLDEACTDLAREGLRTLVFGMKTLSEDDLASFMRDLERAGAAMGTERARETARVMDSLEQGLRLVGITGVEDRLQEDVQTSLETFGASNIRVWMLTGDKVETATCIARSTRMVKKDYVIYAFECKSHAEAQRELDDVVRQIEARRSSGNTSWQYAVVVDGTTLGYFLEQSEAEFIRLAMDAGGVIVARCSPTQKADVVRAVRKFSPPEARTAAIGDGGNDVSMILAAHVGIGIEGKEGRHAALAGDFSITQFSHVVRLFMWHGRNSYKRSCRQSQFVIHRGVVISVIQLVFSLLFNYLSVSVYSSWLLVGYATIFTMIPVFCIVLDEDTREDYVIEFPPLYAHLQKGRSLSLRTFLTWMWISFYQGGVIMCLGIYMFNKNLYRVVALTFTALIVNELMTVFFEMHSRILWRQRRKHLYMFVVGEVMSMLVYLLSIVMSVTLGFNLSFDVTALQEGPFWGRVFSVSAASTLPILLIRELWPSKSLVAVAHREQTYASKMWHTMLRTLK